jgi:predicted SAM-dependent methyltransferase
MARVSLSRSIWSYSKVQRVVGHIIRNNAHQLRNERVSKLGYLDIGCGQNTNSDLINMDYLWHPKVDICWDITKGLPFADGRMLGIFTEHCLEHFPLSTAAKIMRNCLRILAPGGRIRIVVPDAERYISGYAMRDVMPYGGLTSFEGIMSPILDVNRVFYQDRESPFGHWFIYDFAFLRDLLHKIGFENVDRVSFGVGNDPVLLVDTAARKVESLYVEATKRR